LKGIGVRSGKLVSSEQNERVDSISEGFFLKSVNDSLNYTIDLCQKRIMDLSQEEGSSPIRSENGEEQVKNTSDKIKDLLLLIDESKKIKNDLSNLISASEKSGLPPSSPNDVNVAIFALLSSDMTPSKAVIGIVSGLENSYNIFKGLT
jgi:hypothetical protein